MSIAETHAKYVLTPWLAQGGLRAPVIDRGEGSFLVDEEGKCYFDLGSGLIAVNPGYIGFLLVRPEAWSAATAP